MIARSANALARAMSAVRSVDQPCPNQMTCHHTDHATGVANWPILPDCLVEHVPGLAEHVLVHVVHQVNCLQRAVIGGHAFWPVAHGSPQLLFPDMWGNARDNVPDDLVLDLEQVAGRELGGLGPEMSTGLGVAQFDGGPDRRGPSGECCPIARI